MQVRAHVVAVAGVVHHHEQHGLLAQRRVFGLALAPLLDAQLQVVGVFLGDDRALVFSEPGAAGGIRQYRMLDHVLGNGLDQRVVADGLHENRAVVVARRGGDVHLQRQAQVFLQQPMMNVLDRLEPGQARIVDVMRLVVEHGQLVDLAHDLAQIDAAVGGLADGLGPERGQKIVPQVVIVERGFRHLAQIDAVDVGQEQVAGRAHDAHIVLDMQRELEIVPPVVPRVAIVGQYRIVEEDTQTVEVGAQAVEHDDVGRDQQEVARELRIRLVELVEVAPGDQQRQHLGLAGASGHLDHEARPVLVEHVARHRAGGIEAQQVELVACAAYVVKPDQGLDRFTLGKIVAKRALRAVRLLDPVFGLEPPGQQRTRGGRCAGIARIAPGCDFFAHLGHQRRQQLFIGRAAQFFRRREPAQLRRQGVIGRAREIPVQCHEAAFLVVLRAFYRAHGWEHGMLGSRSQARPRLKRNAAYPS